MVQHTVVHEHQCVELGQVGVSLRVGHPCGQQRCLLGDAQYIKQAAGQGRQAVQPHSTAGDTAAAAAVCLLLLLLLLPARETRVQPVTARVQPQHNHHQLDGEAGQELRRQQQLACFRTRLQPGVYVTPNPTCQRQHDPMHLQQGVAGLAAQLHLWAHVVVLVDC